MSDDALRVRHLSAPATAASGAVLFDCSPAGAGFPFARLTRSGITKWMLDPTGPAEAARSELRTMLERVVAKDGDALRQVYERTAAKLYGICLRLLGDEAEAQDVLQDVYVTVWNKANLFDPRRSSPITWLAALARNRAIDRLRSRTAGGRLMEDLEVVLEVPDERPSSFDVLEKAQDSARLRHCLDELEEKARSMIRAAFLEGATYPQLAKREGLPLPTVKSRIRRGLMRLRGCLER